jgi:hypothetical protein
VTAVDAWDIGPRWCPWSAATLEAACGRFMPVQAVADILGIDVKTLARRAHERRVRVLAFQGLGVAAVDRWEMERLR